MNTANVTIDSAAGRRHHRLDVTVRVTRGYRWRWKLATLILRLAVLAAPAEGSVQVGTRPDQELHP